MNTNRVPYTYTTTDDKGHHITSTTTNVEGFNAYGVSIRYQATDFASAPKTSSSVRETPSTSSSRSAPTSESTNLSASNGLSTGAKIGIGVGCAIGFLLFILLGFLVFRLRSRTRLGTAQHQNPSDQADLVQTTVYAKVQPRSELHALSMQKVIELPTQKTWDQPAELPGSGPRR